MEHLLQITQQLIMFQIRYGHYGINTTSPNATLSVKGTFNITNVTGSNVFSVNSNNVNITNNLTLGQSNGQVDYIQFLNRTGSALAPVLQQLMELLLQIILVYGGVMEQLGKI